MKFGRAQMVCRRPPRPQPSKLAPGRLTDPLLVPLARSYRGASRAQAGAEAGRGRFQCFAFGPDVRTMHVRQSCARMCAWAPRTALRNCPRTAVVAVFIRARVRVELYAAPVRRSRCVLGRLCSAGPVRG